MLTASITAAVTVTDTFACEQLVGFIFSQIWYVKVYVPAGVPAATTTLVPDKVIPALVDDTNVVVTCAGLTAIPLSKSLPKTFEKEVPPT